MASRNTLLTTFEPDRIIQPIYTGGDVALDGEARLLATCLGEEALLTDLESGRTLTRLEGDGEVLTALAITPSASHLILCSRSLSMRVYSLQPSDNGLPTLAPTLLRTLKPHATPVITIAIDSTGTLLGTGSADGVVKVWDIRGGFVTHTLRGHNGVISALHFFESTATETTGEKISKQKKKHRKDVGSEVDTMAGIVHGDTATARFRLASGSEDGKIRIWDLSNRKSIATLDSHVSVVRSFDFSANLNILVSAGRDKTAIVWDAHSWAVKRVIPVIEVVESVGFVGNSAFVFTGGEFGRLRIWDSATGREITEEQPNGGEGDEIQHVLHNAGTDFLLSVHADQSLLFHSTSTLSGTSPSSKIEALPLIRRISGTHDEIIDLAFVTPERSLLALATNSESIRLVTLAAQDAEPSPAPSGTYFGADVALLRGHEDIIICLDVDWSGCWLATGAKDNTARLWRIDHARGSYEHYATYTGHAESLGAIALAQQPSSSKSSIPDPLENPPRFLLTGSQDKTVKRWNVGKPSKTDTKSGTQPLSRAIYTRKAHDKDINAISVSYDNALFASASQDRTVKIWSVEDGELQGILRGHRRGVWSVMFAPKDTPAISGDSTGPASTRYGVVLTGSGDKTVKIWSLTDYSCLRTLEGHTNSVLKVLWMPLRPSDDTTRRPVQIASAGGDGLVKIWDANTGEPACTLDNHTDRIWALAVDPSTNTLVSGGGDSVVTFWKDTTAHTMAATAAASTARVEQEQQLLNYMHAGSYREAIVLALTLHHPARLLSLFQGVVDRSPPEEGSLSGVKAVDEVLMHLSDEQLLELLRRLRDWNTNARTAVVAQRILNVVVRCYPAERLVGLRGRGWKEVVDGLRAYTERHYKRMVELMDESYLVEYTLRQMEEVGVVDGENGLGEIAMVS
ncbi:U3 small nucleolar RNA-associated protein 13 [Xanthoria calcicola]